MANGNWLSYAEHHRQEIWRNNERFVVATCHRCGSLLVVQPLEAGEILMGILFGLLILVGLFMLCGAFIGGAEKL